MKEHNFVAPMQMSLGHQIYSVKRVHDNEGDIEYTWYDITTTRIDSLSLHDDGKHVVINEGLKDKHGKTREIMAKKDDENTFLADKESAVEIAQEQNAGEKRKVAKTVENGKAVLDFFKDLEEKTEDGEIYK